MAVEQARIKARLKALFPKANLSKTRLDALAAKLSQKPADDADDAAIDEILTQANDFHSFEDIAKDDDRIRTLDANKPTPSTPPSGSTPPAEPNTPSTPASGDDEIKTLLKTLAQEVQTLKSEKQQATIQQQLKAKLPDVPDTYLKRVGLPASIDELDAFAEGVQNDYTALKQELINSQAGGKVPQGSGPSGKEASKEQIDAVLDNIM